MIVSKRPDVDRILKGPPDTIRAVLLYGKDRGGVRERADGLAKRITPDLNDPFNVAMLTETDLDQAGRLEEELTALSMIGGRRLIRVRLTGERAGPDKTAAEALSAHAEGRLNPDAFLIVEAGALGRDSALRKAAEKAAAAAAIPCYEDEQGDVARMAREALSADKVSLDSAALDLFASRMPKERGVARQEIERLILWIGPGSGRQVTAAELEDFLGVEPEASLFEAANDAFGGRLGAAQQGLARAAAEGESGPPAVRAMGMHLAKLRRTLTLVASGAGLPEAAKASGVFWKQEREFLRQARAWTLDHIDALQP